MNENKLTFISIERKKGKYLAFVPIEGFLSNEDDLEVTLSNATKVYEEHVKKMRKILTQMEKNKAKKKPLSALSIWKLGNIVWELNSSLAMMQLQIDSLYSHLERDLGIGKRLIKNAITFRRYLETSNSIPASLNWRKCSNSPRKTAIRIAQCKK